MEQKFLEIGSMKNLILIMTVITLQSCSWAGPRPILMDMDPPGSPEFKMGFKDGCESGFATYGTFFYKLNYSFYQNYEMLSNVDYDRAWHEAFNYCRHYSLKWNTHDTTGN